MSRDGEQRRLSAILAADVAGYTRLIEQDTEGTVAAWKSARDKVIHPAISGREGRIVKFTGDGFLAEFPSVEDAVNCAMEIQEELADGVLGFRMGIHLGDVIDDGQDIHGEGVNIAARIEAIAERGGISISGMVFEAVRNRIDANFEDFGEHQVKNVSAPIRVYRIISRVSVREGEEEDKASRPLVPPSKPSIAVLPFTNMTADSEQEYFADGMTEDIITGLSRFRSLLVTARNSTFAYKGRSPDVRAVARDLGVRYVLEGSVRRGGDRIRITGQLVDASTGNHLWAERYERELKDIFAVQDEVTEAIVAAIAPEISDVERERAERSPPGNLDAWALYQRGLAAYYSSTEENLRSAITQLDRVSEIDPAFAPAFSMAANARWRYVMHFDPDDRSQYLSQALEKAYTAIKLDPRDPTGLWAAGKVHGMLGEHDVAVLNVEEAIRLNPNDAIGHYFLGSVLRGAGRHEEAIPHLDHAMRLSPRDIWITGMLTDRAFVLFALERYEETLEWAQRARSSPNPRTMTFAILAAVLSKLGRQEEARSAVADFMTHAPGMTCKKYRRNLFGTPEVMARLVEALGKAGLPK